MSIDFKPQRALTDALETDVRKLESDKATVDSQLANTLADNAELKAENVWLRAQLEPLNLKVGVNVHPAWDENKDPVLRNKSLDMLRDAGVKYVRFDIAWSAMEPSTRGIYDEWWMGQLATWCSEFKAHGMKAAVTIMWAPKWATGKVDSKGQAISNAVVKPEYYADFGRFCGEIATRFSDVIDLVEMWNEPDLNVFWETEDPVSYVTMLKAAYPVAKAASPSTIFMAGAPTYLGLRGWFDACYKAGFAKGKTHDCVGIHPYISPANVAPGTLSNEWSILGIAKLHKLMRDNMDTSAIVASEFGWSTHTNEKYKPTEYWNLGVSEADQAKFLGDALPLLKDQGVVRAYWYEDRNTLQSDVHQKNYGLMYRDATPKPAYAALRTALVQQSV